ncbi:MAG: tetratricopeptide repeat protein [Crocinitomicaceae bacterium]
MITLVLFFNGQLFGQIAKEDWSENEKKAQKELVISEDLVFKNLESALEHGIKAEKLLPTIKSTILQCQILNNLGEIYMAKGNLSESMQYLLQSKSLIETAYLENSNDAEIVLAKADVLIKIGTLNLQLKNYNQSLSYYEEALLVIKKLNAPSLLKKIELRELKIYNNIAAVLMQEKEFESALVYLQNALKSNNSIGNASIESTLYNNIGICYLEKKEHDLASHYLQKSLALRKKSNDKQGQAQVYNNIGKNEIYNGNFDDAKVHFIKALQLSQEIGSKQSALVSLESLYSVNDTLGNYKEALHYFRDFKILNDSLFNTESRTAIINLEASHKLEIEKKHNEAIRLKSQIRNYILFGFLLLLLVISIFVLLSMRTRMKNSQLKQEKLELEQENLNLEHRTLYENLDFKDRELTANALYLLKNNELILRITEDLTKAKASFSKENQILIQEILHDLRDNQNNSMWNEFEAHFTKVHTNFYPALQEKFPNLTSNEKKLCAFLRLNMSTKDISAITQQSINSITVARSRLRKKLNIEGEDIHLINFLMKI